MFRSSGRLVYQLNPFKLIVKVDDEIGKYYRSLIPKFYKYQQPLYDSHISVIRNESPIHICSWNKYSNLEIDFEYDSYIYCSETYYWLNVNSKFLEEVRIELGLTTTSEFSKPPDGSNCFHITIANTKHLLK